MSDQQPMRIDPARAHGTYGSTGILTRGHDGERMRNCDIAELDSESLLAWLRSRGGNNPYAENVVGIILGHGALHSEWGPVVMVRDPEHG